MFQSKKKGKPESTGCSLGKILKFIHKFVLSKHKITFFLFYTDVVLITLRRGM